MYDTQCCCYFARKGQISRVDQLFQLLKLRSLSNDDSDDNENGKKVGSDWQNNSFAFLYLSLPSLHTYNVKLLFSRIVEDVNTKRQFLFLFLNFDTVLQYSILENSPLFVELNEMELKR